ncbi:MAG: DUF2236 domain-containing protein [Acidimicrobiia bacterium]|nr:DUF2236 domain-containing protein [Acidimicrobiia bacterium]
MDRIEDIAFSPMDPRLRNELITRTYGDLAQAMAELFGTTDATWAGFGQWASHTIGRYLQLRIPRLGTLIARAFGDGNRDVFADIGRAHIMFLETVGRAHLDGGDLDLAWRQCFRQMGQRLFSPPGGPDGGTEDEFWASIRDPRLEGRPGLHNPILIMGFRAYRNALSEPDPDVRSRHILLGNCLLGLHEQRLLSLAITVGFRSWLRTLTTPWQMFRSQYRWRHSEPGRWRLGFENWWIHFATRHLITVHLASGDVKVGRPVPDGVNPIRVRPGHREPAVTTGPGRRRRRRSISALSDEELLSKLFGRLRVDGRAAACWNDLDDRMAFIAATFAQHQRDHRWFNPNGEVHRPRPWSGLESELEHHRQRVAWIETAGHHQQEEATANVDSPLTDEQLDELRTISPDLARLGPNTLVFDDIGRNDEGGRAEGGRAEGGRAEGGRNKDRQALQPIFTDFAQTLDRISRPGQLLDPDNNRRVRHLFRNSSTMWFLGLLMRSLPESYASAIGAHALGQVSDLATNAFRRSGETARFVLDILSARPGWKQGRLVPGGPAARSIVGVRAMHAIVAGRLQALGWDDERHGAPINVEDLLGAALAFCVPPIEMIEQLRGPMNPENRDAYVQFWMGIGVLLGIPEQLVRNPDGRCIGYEQALALSLAIRRRHHTRSLDGVRLTEALLVGAIDGFPRFAGWMAPGLMQVLGRDEVNRMLMITVGPGRTKAALVARLFSWMLSLKPFRPLIRRFILWVGKRWIRPFVEQGRTRPYRRPLQPEDDVRIRSELKAADNWPADCPVDRRRTRPINRPGPRSPGGQEERRRKQTLLAPQALWLTR